MKSFSICLLLLLGLRLPASEAQDQSQQMRESSVRALIQAFADARNAHDGGAVAALYGENGEWLSAPAPFAHTVTGKRALSALWGSLPGKVNRTIISLDFPSPNIAVARVATKYESLPGLHSEIFVLVDEGVGAPPSPDVGAWKIRVHQTID